MDARGRLKAIKKNFSSCQNARHVGNKYAFSQAMFTYNGPQIFHLIFRCHCVKGQDNLALFIILWITLRLDKMTDLNLSKSSYKQKK